jgi:hypothetical protein
MYISFALSCVLKMQATLLYERSRAPQLTNVHVIMLAVALLLFNTYTTANFVSMLCSYTSVDCPRALA